ncbi:putative Heterokaryon incompatibility domain-containing protein [Seiridium unicorne]|uniref:Heterokaryon incompatibility domain-containing protein n=1 Tax=Seiridium unicorne TaxID=138068 RepID=A0ABR2VBK3_9PEZI
MDPANSIPTQIPQHSNSHWSLEDFTLSARYRLEATDRLNDVELSERRLYQDTARVPVATGIGKCDEGDNEAASLEACQYKPLPGPGWMRVLIMMGSECHEDQITITLKNIPILEKRLRYAALSYVWGSGQQPLRTITCERGRLTITQTCYDILQTFRRHVVHSPNEFAFLWIDQICIDQSSDTDKTLYVSQMDLIYRNAYRVFIWVGFLDEASRRALEKVAGPGDIATGAMTN